MKIAILGWGSLIWDAKQLPLAGEWRRGGPTLPIEFSRISGGDRLTLVIDEECGTRVPTRYAESADADMISARESLKKREGAALAGIAAIDLLADTQIAVRSHPVCELVTQWAKRNGMDGVVWTALQPNFVEKLKKPYSWETAFSYLDGLDTVAKEKAFKYIRRAPEEVRTSFRCEFEIRYPLT